MLAVLVIVTLPETEPNAAGEKDTAMITEAPGVRPSPYDIPLTVKPAPVMVTFEIVTRELLVFVNVTPRVLLVPTAIFPNVRAEVLGFSPEITLGEAEGEAEGEAASEAEGEAPTVPLHPD